MSAAKDEAKNGQLDFESEEGDTGEKDLEEDENRQAEEDDILPLTSRQLNGDEESENTAASDNSFRHNGEKRGELAGEMQGSMQATRPGLGRPSSADGSLSIPDDTPSVQVRALAIFTLSAFFDDFRAQ